MRKFPGREGRDRRVAGEQRGPSLWPEGARGPPEGQLLPGRAQSQGSGKPWEAWPVRKGVGIGDLLAVCFWEAGSTPTSLDLGQQPPEKPFRFSCSGAPPRRKVILREINKKEKKSKNVGGEKFCQMPRYKKSIGALAGWLDWLTHHPVHQRLRVPANPVGLVRECFSFFLSFSPSLSTISKKTYPQERI